MTTIAYRNGIMASDSRAYSGDKHPIGEKQKIFQFPDGTLVGASSSVVGEPDAFIRWLMSLGKDADYRSAVSPRKFLVASILVRPDGSGFYWDDGENFTGPLENEFYAVGSGEQSAYAAMLCGKSAAEAIEIAIMVDPWTGGRVRTLTHEV